MASVLADRSPLVGRRTLRFAGLGGGVKLQTPRKVRSAAAATSKSARGHADNMGLRTRTPPPQRAAAFPPLQPPGFTPQGMAKVLTSPAAAQLPASRIRRPSLSLHPSSSSERPKLSSHRVLCRWQLPSTKPARGMRGTRREVQGASKSRARSLPT